MGCEGESEGKREKTQKKRKVKKKKRAEGHISIKLLVRNSDLSLLDAFIDELGFVTDNVLIYIYDFIFSDDLFSSVYVIFSDENIFVTNSVLINTFSDEIFRHKKPKLLATNQFVAVAKFSLIHISIRLLVRN